MTGYDNEGRGRPGRGARVVTLGSDFATTGATGRATPDRALARRAATRCSAIRPGSCPSFPQPIVVR